MTRKKRISVQSRSRICFFITSNWVQSVSSHSGDKCRACPCLCNIASSSTCAHVCWQTRPTPCICMWASVCIGIPFRLVLWFVLWFVPAVLRVSYSDNIGLSRSPWPVTVSPHMCPLASTVLCLTDLTVIHPTDPLTCRTFPR